MKYTALQAKSDALLKAKTGQAAIFERDVSLTLFALVELGFGDESKKTIQAVKESISKILFDAEIPANRRSEISTATSRVAAKLIKQYGENNSFVLVKDADSQTKAIERLAALLAYIGVDKSYKFMAYAKTTEAKLSGKAAKDFLGSKTAAKPVAAAKDESITEEASATSGESITEEAPTVAPVVVDSSEKAVAAILPLLAKLDRAGAVKVLDSLNKRLAILEAERAVSKAA